MSSTRWSRTALSASAARDCAHRPTLPRGARSRPVALPGRVDGIFTVLDAERTLLQAEQQYATSSTNVSLDLVQLFKALGGGWETAFPDLPAETAAVPLPASPIAVAVQSAPTTD